MRTISNNGLEFIKAKESFEADPYLDIANVPTIGYGTTKYPNGVLVSVSDPEITMGMAVNYLKQYVSVNCEKPINKLVKVDLSQNQFDALCSLVYNIGVSNFKTSTLLKELNKGNYQGACDQFAVWNKVRDYKSKEKRLIISSGLTRRRKEEALLFCKEY
jgi:lysozyme